MEYFYSVLLEVHTSSTSVRCCHICVREFKKKKRKASRWKRLNSNTGTETEWGLKLWNAWQNFSMEHEVTARRGAIVILMQFNFRMRNLSNNPQPVILFTSSNELRCSPGWGDSFPPPFYSSQRWNTGEKFNDLSLRQPADFHPGGERNERNALMCGDKQLHCVCSRGLIRGGMNLEITGRTVRNTATTHTRIM